MMAARSSGTPGIGRDLPDPGDCCDRPVAQEASTNGRREMTLVVDPWHWLDENGDRASIDLKPRSLTPKLSHPILAVEA